MIGTTVDSVEEVEKLAVTATLPALIRIKVDDAGSLMPFSKKFGADIKDVPKIADAARALHVPLKGISFHVGSGCGNALQYYKAIQAAHYGLSFLPTSSIRPIIDIGGGFTGGKEFEEAAKQIRKAQAACDTQERIEWIAEPGRFFAEQAIDLFTQVIGKKKAESGGKAYTIDESLYGQFSCIPYDQAKPKWIRISGNNSSLRKRGQATLFGRTCDSVDVIAHAADAEELEEGDWLWWPNMGAYTSVTATEFNGFPLPRILVEDNLPAPADKDFTDKWPQELKYASPVKSPLLNIPFQESMRTEQKYA